MNIKPDKIQIRNFLTIRYNPLDKPLISPATWENFKQKTTDPQGYQSENLLRKSISRSLDKIEGTICVSLSSGIDSTLCLALLRKVFPKRKILAICAVFEDAVDESKIAKQIAEKFEADFKILHMESLFANMPEIIFVTKKPRWNTYSHLVAKEAGRHGKILVTGDGADELFGGYTFRYDKFLKLLKDRDSWSIRVKKYLECHNRDWVPDQQELFGNRIKFDWNEIYKYFKYSFTNPLPSLQQVMLADFNGKLLYDFIPTGKAIYNHYNLVGAPIFLDPDVIRFAQQLPIEQKYDHGKQIGKLILRKITEKLGVKHSNEKLGFSPSLFFDWKNHGKNICQNYLLNRSSNIFHDKIINYEWVVKAFEKIEDDGDVRYLNRIISILALEIWYRIFITKEMKETQTLA
ncbi:Asparagine synthase [uncultured archaeon]|nr:Asparagine synthase [uncultured archaeon]